MSTLDRSIPVLLSNPDDTASRKSSSIVSSNTSVSISAAEERLYRLHGTGIIHEAWAILQSRKRRSKLSVGLDDAADHAMNEEEGDTVVKSDERELVDATASVIFHRFFHAVSLVEADVWSIAMASLLIAAKVHTVTLPVRHLILAFIHVYRKRTLLILPVAAITIATENNSRNVTLERSIQQHSAAVHVAPSVAATSQTQRRKILQDNVSAISTMGPIWKDWHEAVVQAEAKVLRQLGFTFYWIPDSHPHWYAQPFVQALLDGNSNNSNIDNDDGATNGKASVLVHSNNNQKVLLTAKTLFYCHLSTRLDLCLRLDAAVVCCAAICCALSTLNYQVIAAGDANTSGKTKDVSQNQWWHVFCANEHYRSRPSIELDQDISNAVNALLGLDIDGLETMASEDVTNLDVLVANFAFVKSKVVNGSFNDPTSFVWEMLVDQASTQR